MEKFKLSKIVQGEDVNIRLQQKMWYGWRTIVNKVCYTFNCREVISGMVKLVNKLNKL